MAKPYIHAQSSAKRFGGCPEDYLDIHDFLDSSKSTIADVRHRCLSHNSWFLSVVIEKVFGHTRKNSDGKIYSTREVAEQHVLEDFNCRFIPSAQDYLQEIEIKSWMQNGKSGSPPSFEKINNKIKKKVVEEVIDSEDVVLDGVQQEIQEDIRKEFRKLFGGFHVD